MAHALETPLAPLVRDFRTLAARGDAFALVTVIETEGSTYRKAGAQMLIAADGEPFGLLSGGCLEADLALHARTVVNTGSARRMKYDMRGEDDRLFGIGSALGAELVNKAGDRRLGAVNLYWATPRVITTDEVSFAHLMTRHAALALDASLTVEGLNIALDGRKRIGQAQGILMERHGLDEDQAFAVLKRYSQDNNIKLRDLAEPLVTTRRLPPDRGTRRGGEVRLRD